MVLTVERLAVQPERVATGARAGQSAGRASLGQAPLALFMVGYTVFGLWLLATPRGVCGERGWTGGAGLRMLRAR